MSIERLENLSKTKDGLNLIQEYEKGLTIRRISKKYNLSRAFIKDFLQYNNIHIKRSFLTKKNKEIFESNVGKKIVEEYHQPGNNVRVLSRKYNLTRSQIRIILAQARVRLKSEKVVKREYKDLGISTGKNHPNFGKKPSIGAGKCRWYHYNGVTYQGSWEFKLGLWLEHNNVEFKCHNDVRQFEYSINNDVFTYCPDFFIVKENKFIEVKGYFTEKDKQKIDIVRKTYPDVIIEIYDKKILSQLKILKIDQLLNMCLDEYEINYKDNESLNDFLNKFKDKKNEIIKDVLVYKLNLSDLAFKYKTTYRIIQQIYHLWIKEYYKNKHKREQFISLIFKTKMI